MHKKLVRAFLFLFFILSGSFANAESIKLFNTKNGGGNAIDSEKGIIYIFSKDSLAVIDLETFTKKNVTGVKIDDSIQLDELIPIVLHSELYLVYNQGGQVYKYNGRDFKRIDNSYAHKMQIGSTLFIYKDMIFRYGGYGFWSFRNIFTYFEFKTSEWELYPPSGSKEFPPGTGLGTVVKIIGEDIYLFGGKTMNQPHPFDSFFSRELWKFNIKSKSWLKVGILDDKLPESTILSIDYRDKLILVSPANTFVLDIKSNKFREYENSYMANYFHQGGSNYYKTFYWNGYFYIFGSNSNDLRRTIYKISEKEFLGGYLGEHNILKYSDKIKVFLIVTSIVFVLFTILFLILRSKKIKEKIKLIDKKIVYKTKEIELEDTQAGLLKLFLNSESLNTTEIIEYLHKNQLHYSQNTRIINNAINEINFKLGLLWGRNIQFIEMHKSEIDKRIKVYSIQHRYFVVE